MPTNEEPFEPIESEDLEGVAGGATRRSSTNSDVTAALTAIQSSIHGLAGSRNQQYPMQMMMIMMMMMGGFGGGGGGGVVAAPASAGAAASAPVINIATGVSGGGYGPYPVFVPRGKGKKGW